jgi:hypothetical protein
MRIFRSVLAQSIAVTAALLITASTAAPALASGHSILREDLMGIAGANAAVNPSQPIAGVPAGGAQWVVADGSKTRVREDGRITVTVRGLVIPGRVPPNPVPSMFASLVCNDMVVASTRPFDVSPDGNGQVSDRISVPDRDECDNPMVLVRGNIPNGPYFAVAADD